MDSNPLDNELLGLERKIHSLINKYKELSSDYKEIQEENALLKQHVEDKNREIKNFQNQIKITKIVDSINKGKKKKTELKLLLNEYIKEVDKCVAFISKS